MSNDTKQVVVRHTITRASYEAIEKSLSNTVVNNADTQHTVAYKLGIEAALKHIRNNYVVN